jgi:hypothetical protein
VDQVPLTDSGTRNFEMKSAMSQNLRADSR